MGTLAWCFLVWALAAPAPQDADRRAAEVRAARESLDRLADRLGARRVRWQEGHAAVPLHDVHFSPDGELLLTSGVDGSVRLWDAYNSRHLAALGPFSPDARAAFDASGENILVFDSKAARATLWDGRSGDFRARLGVADEIVLDAAFTPSGRSVLTATATGLVRRWAAATAERALEFEVDPRGVTKLCVHPGGTRVLALGAGGRASLYSVEDGELLATFGDDTRPVLDAGLGPDGSQLVTLGPGGSVGVQDLDPSTAPALFTAPGALLFDGMLRRGGARCLVWTADGNLRLWKVDEGTAVDLRAGGVPLATPEARFSSDGTRVLVLSFKPNRDGSVSERVLRLWDADGESAVDLAVDNEWTLRLAAAFATDASCLAVGERSYEPVLLDASTGGELGTLRGMEDWIWSLAFSPDGARIVAGSYRGYAALWHLDRPAEPLFFQPRSRTVWGWHQGLSPDGSSAVTAGFRRPFRDVLSTCAAQVWDLRTAEPQRVLAVQGTAVQWGIFDPASRRIATAGRTGAGDGVVHLWDVRADAPRTLACGPRPAPHMQELVTGIAFNADGSRLCTTAYESGVRVWDAGSGALLADFPELARSRTSGCARLSPDGSQLAAPGPAQGVVLWDEARDAGPRALGGHTGLVRNVAFSPDGGLLVSSGLDDGTARIWDVPSGRPHAVLRSPSGVVHWAEFGLQGRVVVTGEGDAARVWNTASGALEKVIGESVVMQLAVAPSGDRVLILTPQEDPHVFSLPEGDLVAVLAGHTAPVGGAAFSADGRRILTAGPDDAVRLWDEKGKLLLTRVAFEAGEWLALEPNGYYVGTEQAADWARIDLGGRSFPLSSYAKLLRDPSKVRATLAGEHVPALSSSLPAAPELTLVAPRERTTASRRVTVDVLLEDRHGIEAVDVLQDGVPLAGLRGVPQPDLEPTEKEGRLTFDVEIPPGRTGTTLSLRATNKRGILSAEKVVYVRYQPPQRDLYLLALAVADYDDDALDLDYPLKDADDLAARLGREQGAFYREVRVERLTDRAVTPGAVKRLRDEFLRRAGREDTVLVFVAGHGASSASGDYYFLTSDATPAEPHDGLERELLDSLIDPGRLAARQLALLIDTCMSGDVLEEPGVRLRGMPVVRGSGPFSQRELEEASNSGRYILTATSEFGYAREMRGNGLFTRALLKGLDGAADAQGDVDRLVEIEELMGFARRYVLEHSDGRQEPEMALSEGGGNFALARVPADAR